MSKSRLSRVALWATLLAASSAADEASARLTLVASATVTGGLDNVDRLLVSPDDRFVFATALAEHSVESFERDPMTGDLSFRDAARDGLNGFNGLDSPGEPALDPSGRHLYVPSRTEDSLAVLGVGPSGQLDDFLELQAEGFGGVAGLDAPEVARISPDGAFVYVGGTTAIAIFERDDATGALDWIGQQVLPDLADEVLSMELSPDGTTLYVGSDEPRLYAYARSPSTGLLALVDTESDGAGGLASMGRAGSLAVDRDGRHLYAGGIISLFVFTRSPDGTLEFAQGPRSAAGSSPRVQLAAGGGGLWSSAFDVGGVATWRQDFHPIDGATGLLGLRELALFQSKNMNNGRIVVSRDGRHLYVSDGLVDSIDVASIDPLVFVERQLDGIAGVDGINGARSAAASADGRHVYVAGYNDSALSAFARDAETGSLDFVEAEFSQLIPDFNGLAGTSDVALSPDGKHVYVSAELGSAVSAFSRNATTGALGFVQTLLDGAGAPGIAAPSAVAMSPDGKHLYVTSPTDDAITAFSRNASTGVLSFVEEERNGVGGVTGLDGVVDLVVSRDGSRVFAVGFASDSLVVFSRNGTTGALAFLAHVSDTTGQGLLNGASGIADSPDGRNLYVVARLGDGIAVFSIVGGSPSFVEGLVNATGFLVGLDGARAVAVTGDGRHVVAVSDEGSGAIAVFRRDGATGGLAFAQAKTFFGGDVLEGWAVAASPDGRHVYVAQNEIDSVAVFAPEPGAAGSAAAASGALIALQCRRRLRRVCGGSRRARSALPRGRSSRTIV